MTTSKSKMSDTVAGTTSRGQFQGNSLMWKTVLVGTVFILLLSPTQAYFMKCQQFCSMLTKDEIKQLWCIYDMCRQDKLGRHLLRYAKRGYGGHSSSSSFSSSTDPLIDATPPSDSDLNHGRKQRFSKAPSNALFQSIVQARKALEEGPPLRPAENKREEEYWDGPAPAYNNA